MAERYDFYVHDNRKITFNLTEPIMREDSGVTDFVFHIPKILNELEVSDWQWWFVFVNAKKEKYSIALTLSDDPESPLENNLATYTVDYAMSIKAGSVQFALEAINTGTGGAIDNEWHTLTYETKVKETLQGNQAEYAETESDIISALIQEVRTKMNQIVGGATPTPVSAVSQMTDTSKLYLLTTDGEWYYYNGSTWTSGGVYGAGVTDSVPTQGSTNAVQSGGVYSALDTLQAEIADIEPGLSSEAKTALLACFQHVAWVDEHGQSYYNALESALYEDVPVTLRSIVATFNQGSAIIYTDTALDDLKQYLTVTARYSDGTSHAVTEYILSGTLREGTSAITVTYGGKSTSFTIQNVIDFYNIWEWDSTNTNHSKLTRTPTAAFEKVINNEKLGIDYADNMIPENMLRGFAVTKGKHKMRNYSDGSVAEYYPIPIPATAKKFTATITPSTQKLAVYVFKYTGNGRQDGYDYELVAPAQIGYVTGEYVLNFASDSNLFITFNCTPSNGNYGTNPEPEMHILFE